MTSLSMPADPHRHRRAALLALSAFALVAIAFGPHLGGDFVWDDTYLVRDNPTLRSISGLRIILTHDLWGGATGRATQLFHPLPMATLWLQARITDLSLVAFRLGNIALHLACALALYALLRRREIRFATAAIVTLLFLVHPSVTEPVEWITGRHDSLGLLFTLLAALSLPRAAERAAFVPIPALCVVLAFLCKEPFVVAPVLALLVAPRAFLAALRARSPRVVSATLLMAMGVLCVFALRHALGISSGSDALHASFTTHLRDAASITAHYLAQIATLSNGCTIQSYATLNRVEASAVLCAEFVATCALMFFASRGSRTARGVLSGWLWFLVASAPLVIALPILNLFANRYAYAPMAGLCVAFAHAIEPLVDRQRAPSLRRVLAGACALALVALAFQLSAEASYWQSDVALYGHDLERRPDDGRVLYHYGTAVQRREGCEVAEPFFARATQIVSEDERSWHNLAGCRLRLGRFADAVDPAARAVALGRNDPRNWYNLGVALAASGDRVRGRRALEQAVRLDPGYAAARDALARL